MQGTILAYIGSIVTAIILSEVLLSLLPEGNMQKFVKPVIGILLLLLLLMLLQNALVQTCCMLPAYKLQ